jgi:hypothetical protein
VPLGDALHDVVEDHGLRARAGQVRGEGGDRTGQGTALLAGGLRTAAEQSSSSGFSPSIVS